MRRRLTGWAAVVLLAAGCGPLSQTHHKPGNSHEVATAPPGGGGQGGEARAVITVRAGG